MWLVAAPVAVLVVVYVGRRFLRAPPPTTEQEGGVEGGVAGGVEIVNDVVEDADLLEGGVQVSDILQWLDTAADRLSIKTKPILVKVVCDESVSICLRFTAGDTGMKLWVSGLHWMGPFPRLTVPDRGPEDKGIVLEERSAVCLERAIVDIQKAN